MSYTIDTTNIPKSQKQIWITSSLKLIKKLASTNGEIGMVLRQKICQQPLILSNVAEVLEDSCSSKYQIELVMEILAKLSIDMEAREDIFSFQVFIHNMVNAFLGRDQQSSLRNVAGEALSLLSVGNARNFSAILEVIGPNIIDLKDTLLHDEYTYVTASSLQNVCAESLGNLKEAGSSGHLSSFLPLVLAKIMNRELQEKKFEALVSLASQIGKVLPQYFAHQLLLQHDELPNLVKKLVDTLNSCKKPSLNTQG